MWERDTKTFRRSCPHVWHTYNTLRVTTALGCVAVWGAAAARLGTEASLRRDKAHLDGITLSKEEITKLTQGPCEHHSQQLSAIGPSYLFPLKASQWEGKKKKKKDKQKQNKTSFLKLSATLHRKIPVIPKPDKRKCDTSCVDNGSKFYLRSSVDQVAVTRVNILFPPPLIHSILTFGFPVLPSKGYNNLCLHSTTRRKPWTNSIFVQSVSTKIHFWLFLMLSFPLLHKYFFILIPSPSKLWSFFQWVCINAEFKHPYKLQKVEEQEDPRHFLWKLPSVANKIVWRTRAKAEFRCFHSVLMGTS